MNDNWKGYLAMFVVVAVNALAIWFCYFREGA